MCIFHSWGYTGDEMVKGAWGYEIAGFELFTCVKCGRRRKVPFFYDVPIREMPDMTNYIDYTDFTGFTGYIKRDIRNASDVI